MPDVTPELISEISARLLQEAQSAAAGGTLPGLGTLLPSAAAEPTGIPDEVAMNAIPVKALSPIGGGVPGIATLPEPSFLGHLPSVPNTVPATLPSFSTPTADSANENGLRGFIERVQASHYRSPD